LETQALSNEPEMGRAQASAGRYIISIFRDVEWLIG